MINSNTDNDTIFNPPGYSRCYCLLHPIKKQFLNQEGGSDLVYMLLRSSSQPEGDANKRSCCLRHVLATHGLHLTSRPSKSWPITTSPSGERQVLHCPIFLPRCQNESKKDAERRNKAGKSNCFLDDTSKHNTTPPDAKANAHSPAILSSEGVKKSRRPAGDIL